MKTRRHIRTASLLIAALITVVACAYGYDCTAERLKELTRTNEGKVCDAAYSADELQKQENAAVSRNTYYTDTEVANRNSVSRINTTAVKNAWVVNGDVITAGSPSGYERMTSDTQTDNINLSQSIIAYMAVGENRIPSYLTNNRELIAYYDNLIGAGQMSPQDLLSALRAGSISGNNVINGDFTINGPLTIDPNSTLKINGTLTVLSTDSSFITGQAYNAGSTMTITTNYAPMNVVCTSEMIPIDQQPVMSDIVTGTIDLKDDSKAKEKGKNDESRIKTYRGMIEKRRGQVKALMGLKGMKEE